MGGRGEGFADDGGPTGQVGRRWLGYRRTIYQDAAGHDDWYRVIHKASETGILVKTELDAARRTMTPAEYEQEFECSWSAAIRAACPRVAGRVAPSFSRISADKPPIAP